MKPYKLHISKSRKSYSWWCPFCRKHVRTSKRLSPCRCGRAFFDMDKADAIVEFIGYLKHTKGRQWKGEPFTLLPWQEFEVIRPLFGTVDADGMRIYRKAYVEIPKKNGKSELGAAIALWMLGPDGEPGAEVYSAAVDRKQASIVFDIAAQMIRLDGHLGNEFDIIDCRKRITYFKQGSWYEALSADVGSKEGPNIHGLIFDELHAIKRRSFFEVLTDGSTAARLQPLIFTITTAGEDQSTVCFEEHEYSEKLIDGVVTNPHYLPLIYAADKDDDPFDPKVWAKANPSLGSILDADRLKTEADEAREKPAKLNAFRRRRLNIWVRTESRWLDLSHWDDCAGDPIDEADLIGRECYAGLDLSTTIDLTALVYVFPPDQPDEGEEIGPYIIIPRFFIPKDNIPERVRKDRIPYDLWAQQGYLTATPGNVIDHAWLTHQLATDAEQFNIAEVAYDRWGSDGVIQRLQEMGFDETNKKLNRFGQGFASMSGPTKELITLTMSRRLHHGGHPVLRWNADNLVTVGDAAGNLKPDKDKSREKIDGMVALIMALARATRHVDTTSVYEKRGMVFI